MAFESPRFAGNSVLEEILNDPDTGTKKLQKGSDLDAVRRVQQALFDLGWALRSNPPIPEPAIFVDGDYGPATTRVVLEYKTHYDLRYPPGDPNGFIDGYAGPRTLRKLDPQCVLLDEAAAAIDTKIAELSGSGLTMQGTGPTTIFDNSPGANRPAMIASTEGAVFYRRGVGAFEVHGAIFLAYTNEHGSAEGRLGYPVTDEYENPEDPDERISDFERGSLVWSPDSGVIERGEGAAYVQQVVVKLVDHLDLGLPPRQAITPSELSSLAGSGGGSTIPESLAAVIADSVLRPTFDLAGTPQMEQIIAQAKENDAEYSPPNFSNFLELTCPDGVDPDLIVSALEDWTGVVEYAYVDYVPSDPTVVGTTNPMFSQQGHLDAAPRGVGAAAAWVRGADGKDTKFIDLEGGWFLGHEDIPPGIQLLEGEIRAGSRHHGTAVLGIVAGQDNTVGVVGLAPETFARVISYVTKPEPPFDSAESRARVANVIVNGTSALSFGSVLLLEVQFAARFDGNKRRSAPVEVAPAVFRAIEVATRFGVIVVEAAGNGSGNLDDLGDHQGKKFLFRGGADFKDSGAIMVGACTSSTPHSRYKRSNFGSRVNCCAWGDAIVTAGSETTPTKRDAYRSDFAATSGASAIIAGVCLLFQDMRVRLKPKLGTGRAGPFTVRRALSDTQNGTPISGTQPIGVMPDLAQIIQNEFI